MLYEKKLVILARVIQRINRIVNSVDLRYTADIHPTVTLLHNGLGCVIHERAVIGANTTICQNVTVGGNGKRGGVFNVTIGENVFIGAGACILSGGEMEIGDGLMIGANAVVLQSVPPGCTAVGVPARIICPDHQRSAIVDDLCLLFIESECIMKILTVVGARPQFIKAAVGSRILRQHHTEILVHTGQHHDVNMSDIFFEEMEILKPDYNLGIAGGSHGQMTGKMLMAIEEILIKEKPDILLVYGDTNSTLAAALAAVKIHIPIAHVESGNRFGTLDSPEEVNRICTDHISTLRFACTQSAYESLVKENLSGGSYLVGDPMYDAFLYYQKRAEGLEFKMIGLDSASISVPESFYYMTCHRQENTGDSVILEQIMSAMEELDAPTVYPVHPRNQSIVRKIANKCKLHNLTLVEPVGYLESISLLTRAKKIVTDSGGLQREAFFAGKQCVTVLDFVVWPETMVGNRNQLSKPNKQDILCKLSAVQTINAESQPFGDGHAAEKICEAIEEYWDIKSERR